MSCSQAINSEEIGIIIMVSYNDHYNNNGCCEKTLQNVKPKKLFGQNLIDSNGFFTTVSTVEPGNTKMPILYTI